MKQFILFFIVYVLSLSSTTILHAQQKAKSKGHQLQKGNWIIGNNIFTVAPVKAENMNYDNNGALSSRSESKFTAISLLFRSAQWGLSQLRNTNSFSYSATNVLLGNSKTSDASFFLMPSAGYFIKERIMIGGQFRLGFGKRNQETNIASGSITEITGTSSSFGIGPELRYYFGDASKRKYPFAGVSFLAAKTKSINSQITTINNASTTNKVKSKGTQTQLTPYLGYSWLLGKRWLIEPAFMAEFINDKNNSETTTIQNNGNNPVVSNLSSKYKSTSVVGVRLNISFTL